MKLFALTAIAVATIGTPCMADELDDAATICRVHNHVRQIGKKQGFDPGWEHCEKILAAYDKRKAEQDAIDESKDPDMKRTRDLAKGL